MRSAAKAAFLKALAETGSVTAACLAARVSRREANATADEDPGFAGGWAEAMETYVRGAGGRGRPGAVAGGGQGRLLPGRPHSTPCATIRRLLVLRLKALKPDKYRDRAAERPRTPRRPGLP